VHAADRPSPCPASTHKQKIHDPRPATDSAAFLFPMFQNGGVFLQVHYSLNRRRISRLGGDDLFPEISDGCIPFNRIVNITYRLRDAEHRIECAYAGK
jgi:hypothetical protein